MATVEDSEYVSAEDEDYAPSEAESSDASDAGNADDSDLEEHRRAAAGADAGTSSGTKRKRAAGRGEGKRKRKTLKIDGVDGDAAAAMMAAQEARSKAAADAAAEREAARVAAKEQAKRDAQAAEEAKKASEIDDIWASMMGGSSGSTASKPASKPVGADVPAPNAKQSSPPTMSSGSSITSYLAQLNRQRSSSSSSGNAHSRAGSADVFMPTTSSVATTAADTSTTGTDEAVPATITVTETQDFAGDDVTVTRTLVVGSAEHKAWERRVAAAKAKASRQAGSAMGDALDLLKKKKMSTLTKSKLDWDQYKSEHKLDDELADATKDGYVERQEFLGRAEARQYELELEARRAARASRR